MNDTNNTLKILNEFWNIVQSIYGVYLDACQGFHLAKTQHIKAQQCVIQSLKKTSPDHANTEYLDELSYMYGEGDPNIKDSVILHTCTQGEFKARNEETGSNYRFIANMCLISIYQYWEDQYREKIATALEKEKNEIQSDVMRDINSLRQSIIHNNAFASEKVKKCKLLKWFKKGDEIFIDRNMFKDIIYHIKIYIRNFQKQLLPI